MSDWFWAEEVDGVYHFSKWVNTVFFKEEQDQVDLYDCPNFHKSIISKSSDRLRETIQDGIDNGDQCLYVRIGDEVMLYHGKPDYDAAIKAILAYADEQRREKEKEDRVYHLQPGFKEAVIRYLEAARVLIAADSDMEEIINQRDRLYGEEDEIRRCIAGIERAL